MPEAQREKVDILSKVALFSTIQSDQTALELLAKIMNVKTYPNGHTLIEEGTVGDDFFVLIEGQVSIFKNTPEGDSYKVVILNHQSHPSFGEGGLIEAEPRSATVKCDTEVKCLVLKRIDFEDFCGKNPKNALPIVKKISVALMKRLKQTSNDLMLLHKALMHEIRG